MVFTSRRWLPPQLASGCPTSASSKNRQEPAAGASDCMNGKCKLSRVGITYWRKA